MWRTFHDAWRRLATDHHPRAVSDRLISAALRAAAVPYGLAIALRDAAYRRRWLAQVRLPCRVISVGNLTVGGTGKTTCVELIARLLLAEGRRPAVLSRGYAGPRRSYLLRCERGTLLLDGYPAPDPRTLADEPQLLARHLDGVPVLVGPRRDETGRRACAEHDVDTLVLDDGFQHRRLARDCDIVLVRAGMPLGGWPLLPRGPMREPLSALRRADVVVITKADEDPSLVAALVERLRTFAPEAAFVTARHVPEAVLEPLHGRTDPPAALNGRRVGLLSSIGDPDGFAATTEGLHAQVLWHRVFPDHHPYDAADWATLRDQVRAHRPDGVLTTEKDWVRVEPLARAVPLDIPVWVLRVQMELLDGQTAFAARLAGARTP